MRDEAAQACRVWTGVENESDVSGGCRGLLDHGAMPGSERINRAVDRADMDELAGLARLVKDAALEAGAHKCLCLASFLEAAAGNRDGRAVERLASALARELDGVNREPVPSPAGS